MNQLMMLIPKNRTFILEYFKLLNKVDDLYKGTLNIDLIISYRIMLEAYSSLDYHSKEEVNFMVYILSKFNVYVWFYT